jgi:hypothetical protein
MDPSGIIHKPHGNDAEIPVDYQRWVKTLSADWATVSA